MNTQTKPIPPQYRNLKLTSNAAGPPTAGCSCEKCQQQVSQLPTLKVLATFQAPRCLLKSPTGQINIVCLCGCRATILLRSWHDGAVSWKCSTASCPGYVPTMVLTQIIGNGRASLLQQISERARLS